MKRYLMILMLAITACSSNNNNKKDDKGAITSLVNNPRTANGLDTVSAAMKPIMSFKDTVHDFGKIHEGESVTYEFAFTNTGKSPLIITNAVGSCGCTVPEYPRTATAPGASGVIKVTFNSAGKPIGPVIKSVTMRTNTLHSNEVIYIKGEIVAGKGNDK